MAQGVAQGKLKIGSIPERRPPREVRLKMQSETPKEAPKITEGKLAYPVWRCQVCGYICARDEPPELCPICKAKKERFERFL